MLGSGPAGRTLVDELVGRGLQVRAVDRSGSTSMPDVVETVRADLTDPAAAIAATEDAAVVYHCVNVAYHLQVDLMPAITTAVLGAVEAHGARLVVLDTLYPYGEADGGHITESTPWSATSRKGRLRAELDRRYLEAHKAGRIRFSAGRSADFFGPRVLNSTLGGATFPGALTGEPVLTFGDIDLAHSCSYVPDTARGLAVLGTDDRGDGRIWHLPTTPARTTREVLDLVEAAVGRPLTPANLPAATAEAYGPFDATFMAEYVEMYYQALIPQSMVSTAFEQTFDIHPTPMPEAIAATVDWYREFLAASDR